MEATTLVILFIVFVVLLLFSAYTSASEVAFFGLKPKDYEQLNESESSNDKLVLKLVSSPDRLLSTILITNDTVNMGTVFVGSTILSSLIDMESNLVLAFVLETILLTFLLLLFGENIPKIFASNYTLRFARFSAKIMYVLEKILYPLSWLLVKPVSRVNKVEHSGRSLTLDELSQAYEITSDSISEDKDILEGIINFSDVDAAGAMTPRVDVVAVEDTMTFLEVIKVINDSEYSRMPVYHETLDNIVGFLYIKDLIAHLDDETFNWLSVVRKAFFVPDSKHINALLEEFKQNKTHMAVVVDEYGGTAGIITMEDVLEEILGNIDDEHDDTEHSYVKLGNDTYLCEGKMLLNDLYKIEGIEKSDFEKISGEADTLAGLILEIKGEIPKQHTKIDYKQYSFDIVSSDNRRIKTVKVAINKPETDREESDGKEDKAGEDAENEK